MGTGDVGQVIGRQQGLGCAVHRQEKAAGGDLAVNDPERDIVAPVDKKGRDAADEQFAHLAHAAAANDHGVVDASARLAVDGGGGLHMAHLCGKGDPIFGEAVADQACPGVTEKFFRGNAPPLGQRGMLAQWIHLVHPVLAGAGF